MDDPHREDRRGLIEQPLRGERRGGHRQHTAGCLETNALLGDLIRPAEEGEHIARRIGIGENESRLHAF